MIRGGGFDGRGKAGRSKRFGALETLHADHYRNIGPELAFELRDHAYHPVRRLRMIEVREKVLDFESVRFERRQGGNIFPQPVLKAGKRHQASIRTRLGIKRDYHRLVRDRADCGHGFGREIRHHSGAEIHPVVVDGWVIFIIIR